MCFCDLRKDRGLLRGVKKITVFLEQIAVTILSLGVHDIPKGRGDVDNWKYSRRPMAPSGPSPALVPTPICVDGLLLPPQP